MCMCLICHLNPKALIIENGTFMSHLLRLEKIIKVSLFHLFDSYVIFIIHETYCVGSLRL